MIRQFVRLNIMSTSEYFPATAMPDTEWWSALWPDPQSVLQDLGLASGQSVVDLCCGDGHFTVPLAHLVGSGGRIIALDMDLEMLQAARQRMQMQGPDFAADMCSWIQGDAYRIDHETGEGVDVVLMANTFHGVPDKVALAQAVRRALKPQGRFVLINWHALPREQTTVLDQARGPKTEMRLSPDDICRILLPVGFEPENVIDLPPWHHGTVFRLAKRPREG